MSKCEVVFEDEVIKVNGFEISFDFESRNPFNIFKGSKFICDKGTVEEAIGYCIAGVMPK